MWEEFERHYLIEEDEINRKFSNVRLLEEGKIGNYSSFPHAKEMWRDFANYINEYTRANEPSRDDTYGDYYVINVPSDFTKYRFWDKLTCRVRLFLTTGVSSPRESYYKPIDSDEEVKYIQEQGKIKNLWIMFYDNVYGNNSITDGIFLDFMHEFLHAYEDLQRLSKHNKSLLNYNTSVNYLDYNSKRVDASKNNAKLINRLCTLFHFFNKTEIRALISQLSGEIQSKDEFELDQFGIKNFITNTKSWEQIEDSEYTVNLIKNCDDIICQNELVSIFNKHSVRAKVKNFNELVKFLENKMFYVKQYIFKKVSKIIANRQQAILEKCVF